MKKWLYVCCFVLLAVLICTAAYAEDVAVLSDGECEHWRWCDESVCYKCKGDYTGGNVSHIGFTYESDDEEHWQVCVGCGYTGSHNKHRRYCNESLCDWCDAPYTGDELYHTWGEYEGNSEEHWQVCKFCDAQSATNEHSRYCDESVCDDCGIDCPERRPIHINEYSDECVPYNKESHGYPCLGCGEILIWYSHSRRCDETVCEDCGAECSDEFARHSYGDYESDAEEHWRTCSVCAEEASRGKHSCYCDENVCETCGAEYTGSNKYHRYTSFVTQYDETYHWECCLDCGEIQYKERHKASCVDATICGECGAELPNGCPEITHGRTTTTQGDEDYHYEICNDCGDVVYEIGHYAECTHPGTCEGCGATGVNIGYSHASDHIEYQYDEVEHWGVCTDCGTIFEKSLHQSECWDPDCCVFCGATFDGTDTTNHWDIWEEMFYDDTHHWYYCGSCGMEVNKMEHRAYCDNPSVCHTCGATGDFLHSHSVASFDYEHDENEHWWRCVRCGEYIYKEAHFAYCDDLLSCYVCGEKNVRKWSYIAHTMPNDDKKHDAETHEVTCEHCGEIIPFIIDAQKEATCTEDGYGTARCWYCHEDYEAVIKAGHAWSSTPNAEGQIICEKCGEVRGKALKITQQPASTTVASGAKAKVTVGAEGEGLTYQWYVKSVGSTAFTKSSISGPSYSVTMTSARNGNQVYCVVTDQFGLSERTDTVTLTMAPELKITKQPASVEVASGKTAKVTVEADGDGLTYQWYVKAVGASRFTKSSLTGSAYSVKMTTARNGNQVYCVVKDQYGSSVKTNTVTLTMKASSLKITQQPASVEVASGQTAKVSVTAEGEGLSYKWYVKAVGASQFTKSSLTGASYSVKMTTARNGNQVYCVVTDESGATVQSNTVTLTMKASSLKITQQPVSVKVASGKTAKVSVTAEGEGLSYKWYVKAAGTSTFKKSSLTGSSYSVTMTSARNGNQVYCIVTDKSGNTVQSNTVTLTMAAKLAITKQPVSVSVASGAKATVKVEATGESLTYQWYVKAAGTSSFKKSSTTGATYSVTMTSARNGNQVYCVVTDKNGNTVQSNTVTLSKK